MCSNYEKRISENNYFLGRPGAPVINSYHKTALLYFVPLFLSLCFLSLSLLVHRIAILGKTCSDLKYSGRTQREEGEDDFSW